MSALSVSSASSWSDRALRTVLIGAGSSFLAAYLLVAFSRLGYPYEIEWCEGGSVVQVQRILDGKPLYVPPTIEFTPFIYPPLYFWAGSAVARVIGNGFLALRLVSLASSLASIALIFRIVYQRTGSAFASMVGASFFAATFEMSGAWFDLARVDSLFLALLLAGALLSESDRRLVRLTGVPLVLALSFLTKQTALIPIVAVASGAVLLRRGWERIVAPALVLGALLVSAAGLHVATAGWSTFYLFEAPRQQPLSLTAIHWFWTEDVLSNLPIAIVFVLAHFALGGFSAKGVRAVSDLVFLASLFAVSMVSRAHWGGYVNVLMPACAGVAIFFAYGLSVLLRTIGATRGVAAWTLGAALLQFAMLAYWPPRRIPTDEARRQGEAVLERVSRVKGEVFWSDNPWYLAMIGKRTMAQEMALREVVEPKLSSRFGESLRLEMEEAVRARRYEAFVLGTREFTLRTPSFEANYELADSDLSRGLFVPVSGAKRPPQFLFVRRSPPAAPLQGETSDPHE